MYLGWWITWHMKALYNINQVKPNIWPLKVACSGNHSGGARFLPVSLSRPQYQKSEARKIGPPLLFSISGIVASIHFASGSRPAAYFSFSDALMLLWSCWHTRSHQFPDLNSTFLLSDVLASLALIIVTDSLTRRNWKLTSLTEVISSCPEQLIRWLQSRRRNSRTCVSLREEVTGGLFTIHYWFRRSDCWYWGHKWHWQGWVSCSVWLLVQGRWKLGS